MEAEEQNRVSGDGQTDGERPAEAENQTGTDQPSSHGSAGTKTAPSQATTESDRAAISAALASGTYQIQPGETLYGICLNLYGNGSRLEEIRRLNGLEDENKDHAGQNLFFRNERFCAILVPKSSEQLFGAQRGTVAIEFGRTEDE